MAPLLELLISEATALRRSATVLRTDEEVDLKKVWKRVDEPDLAAKLIPCALPTLASKGDMRNLANLARLAQLTVSAMIQQHALWILADLLYKGAHTSTATSTVADAT